MLDIKKLDKRVENEIYIEKLNKENKVKYVDQSDQQEFEMFKGNTFFADNTFTMLYGWGSSCKFAYKKIGNAIACIGIGIDDEVSGSVIYNDINEISECLKYLSEILFCNNNMILDNINVNMLDEIKSFCDENNFCYNITYEDDYSDYVYLLEDYLSLKGKDNKTKRGNMNWFLRNYTHVKYVDYSDELKNDVLSIFSKWCELHDCSNCSFGCEYKSFERILSVYDPEVNICSVVYINNIPVSFSLCERINKDTISCLMQKTSEPIRGLAFYASYCLKNKYGNVKYIDLCEDMGLPGLREDKKSFHPIMMLPKYRINIAKK